MQVGGDSSLRSMCWRWTGSEELLIPLDTLPSRNGPRRRSPVSAWHGTGHEAQDLAAAAAIVGAQQAASGGEKAKAKALRPLVPGLALDEVFFEASDD